MESAMDFVDKPSNPHSTVLCIYSSSYILAIWNLLDKQPLWKFPGETGERGELVTDTAVRAGLEEANLIIPAARDELGVIQELGNGADVKVSLVFPQNIEGHWKYFYKVRISDAHILSLSNKLLRADTDELLWTWAFPFMRPFKMSNFHAPHVKLLARIVDLERYAA